MKIGGVMKLTLLDYPDKVACTVFTVGCNFRCPFCHNSGMVFGKNCEDLTDWDVLSFLKLRKGLLEGVCLTGGEPLIQPDVEEFLSKVKALGYSVKLDTNGSFPDKLISIVENELVDYVAMDVKNSKEMYNRTAGVQVDIDAISRSVEFLKKGKVPYEFRTTVTANFHNDQSIEAMAKWLSGSKKLYLQKFEDSGELIDETVCGCDEETMRRYKKICQKYVKEVHLRGMDE